MNERWNRAFQAGKSAAGSVWDTTAGVVNGVGPWFWSGLLGGRSFALALITLGLSFILAWTHRLDGQWIAVIGGVNTLVHARAAFADLHEQRLFRMRGEFGNKTTPPLGEGQ